MEFGVSFLTVISKINLPNLNLKMTFFLEQHIRQLTHMIQ
jgi:hypothetical protein